MYPSLEITKPVPRLGTTCLRSCGTPCSGIWNGKFGIPPNHSSSECPVNVFSALMLTTPGELASARSANVFGTPWGTTGGFPEPCGQNGSPAAPGTCGGSSHLPAATRAHPGLLLQWAGTRCYSYA